jgi:RHS repeat-associated protein
MTPGHALTGNTEYYHSDHIGSARLMTNAQGTVIPGSDATFLPFGQEHTPTTTTNHYKFTGKERDTESSLDYFGARFDSPTMGRFTTPDAPFADQHIENPQSWNLYAYTLNNPLRYVDPDGFKANPAALARAIKQIQSQQGGSTYTMFFLGINSGEGNYAQTRTAKQLSTYGDALGLGQLDTGSDGNTALIPNEGGAGAAAVGAADQDQVDTADAIYAEAQKQGLKVQIGTHSNGINAAGKFAANLPENSLTNSVVIAPNTASKSKMTSIANASQTTTIITSNRDNRLAMAPVLGRRSVGFWARMFRKNKKVKVVETKQSCHGVQCYGAEVAQGSGSVRN